MQIAYFLYMAKVTTENLIPEMVKAGRALLNMTAKDLANCCDISPRTLRAFEAGGHVNTDSRQAMIDGLEGAGIKLYNGGQPGARLMKEN